MYFTNKLILNDTKNFFTKNFGTILLISIFSALVAIIINYFIAPDYRKLNIFYELDKYNAGYLFNKIQNMHFSEQKILFRTLFAKIFSYLIGNTILLIGIIGFLEFIFLNKLDSWKKKIHKMIIFFPNLLLLVIILTVIIQFGSMIFIIPGLFISSLLSLSPIILFIEEKNVIFSIKKSINLTFKNMKFILPSIIFWMFSKMLILIVSLISHIIIPPYLNIFLLYGINNILLSILIIYLFRFYVLVIIKDKNFL
ncbi:YciC family protein [Buchnera aphidicola (Mindarus keteleerifoliae)]|uniref:YciC family protein n=1 Tax=Buchnera aphidicola TaxID=9 RepID=UPI0031B72966